MNTVWILVYQVSELEGHGGYTSHDAVYYSAGAFASKRDAEFYLSVEKPELNCKAVELEVREYIR